MSFTDFPNLRIFKISPILIGSLPRRNPFRVVTRAKEITRFFEPGLVIPPKQFAVIKPAILHVGGIVLDGCALWSLCWHCTEDVGWGGTVVLVGVPTFGIQQLERQPTCTYI
jgi:hypothetical protein